MDSGSYIAIVSPFPDKSIYMDGWMSRIKTIDMLFSLHRRVYIDFQSWFPANSDPELVEQTGFVTAYRMNPWASKHQALASKIFAGARFVYIHTLHQCEYMLQFFDPAKMLIDVHGVVPEEEAMMGSAERAIYFGRIEAEILARCKQFSVVTKSMANHYLTKYPAVSGKNIIHLPVMDYGSIGKTSAEVKAVLDYRHKLGRPVTVYAGGSQTWQCVDLMLKAVNDVRDIVDMEIYSHNIDDFGRLLGQYGLPKTMFGGNVNKKFLADVYRRSSFGFSIREDSVVNRVASPTKLCDYCSHLVIPIIKFAEIGDFQSYNYAYVTLNEYCAGYIPDRETQEWMVLQNIECMRVMADEFVAGARHVLDLAA